MEEYIKLELNDKIKFLFESLDKSTILPQLAKDYNKEKHKINWDTAYANFKFDGMRCMAVIKNKTVKLVSRKGKIIENMHHIENKLLSLYGDMEIILDGELYTSPNETFQQNMSYIKKYRKGLSEKINFYIYDVVTNKTQSERLEILEGLRYDTCLKKVEYVKIHNEEELKEFHSQAVSDGFEGSMVRWGDDVYKVNGRSSYLLKYKDFLDTTATIIDIIPAEQRPEWGVPVFDGFKAGVKLSHEERVELLQNKDEYIGKTAELRYFELTDDGKPRFGVMVGIRLDK